MLDIVHRDALRLPSNAGSDCCFVRAHQVGKTEGRCHQFVIPKDQPNLAHAGAVQIRLFCCSVTHTRVIFERAGSQQRMRKACV